MGFIVVSKTPHPLEVKHKVEKKLIKEGIIEYTDHSGQEATFTYTDKVKYNDVTIVLPLVRASICIIGRKYCYCYNRFDVKKPDKLIKYVPEEKFKRHDYNCYKYKPGSMIRAEVKEEKAYAIDK